MPNRRARLSVEPSKAEELGRAFAGPGRLSQRLNEMHRKFLGMLSDAFTPEYGRSIPVTGRIRGPSPDMDYRRWEMDRRLIRPDLPPGEAIREYERSALPLGLLAAAGEDQYGPGLGRPPVSPPLPPLPYPFMPQPGRGPVFRVPKKKPA